MKSMEYSRISGQERNDPSSRHKGGCMFLSSKISSFSYFAVRESIVYPRSCRTVYLLISSYIAVRWLIGRSLYQWDPIRNTSFQRHIDESIDQKNRKQGSCSSERFPSDQCVEVHRRADWSRHVVIVPEPTNGRLSKAIHDLSLLLELSLFSRWPKERRRNRRRKMPVSSRRMPNRWNVSWNCTINIAMNRTVLSVPKLRKLFVSWSKKATL